MSFGIVTQSLAAVELESALPKRPEVVRVAPEMVPSWSRTRSVAVEPLALLEAEGGHQPVVVHRDGHVRRRCACSPPRRVPPR